MGLLLEEEAHGGELGLGGFLELLEHGVQDGEAVAYGGEFAAQDGG